MLNQTLLDKLPTEMQNILLFAQEKKLFDSEQQR